MLDRRTQARIRIEEIKQHAFFVKNQITFDSDRMSSFRSTAVIAELADPVSTARDTWGLQKGHD